MELFLDEGVRGPYVVPKWGLSKIRIPEMGTMLIECMQRYERQ